MKTTMMLLVILFTFSGFQVSQERVITGTVTSSDDGLGLPGVNIVLKGTTKGTVTDGSGKYSLRVPASGGVLVFSFIGYAQKEVRIPKGNEVNVTMTPEMSALQEVVVSGYGVTRRSGAQRKAKHERESAAVYLSAPPAIDYVLPEIPSEEDYARIEENIFYGADKKPLSTFSIDVDAASYSNVRRFIESGQQPPKDAVRIEEMINYFAYDYPEPAGNHPFAVKADLSYAPWNGKHRLVRIGLQGKKISVEKLPASNLVFLIDVSGSMNQPNKLPLVKKSFQMLVEQLRPEDHVSIVVYAGAAGTLLEPTAGDEKRKIAAALNKLHAGGSTAGGAGLRMAYALAAEHYKQGGNNRVILATDGDFNIGESSNEAMEDLIEKKRKEGVFLTVLGFGMGNLKDSKMELLADKGNGNYAYIDNLSEARKVLVSEFGGTLFTIAKDVKIQVEFNPAKVLAYRLVGYENRKLKDEDFNNDRKDAGELGSGHSVTALYEIIPVGVESSAYSIDPLKYQRPGHQPAGNSREWLTIKLRYKQPDGDESHLLQHILSGEPVALARTDDDFRWAAAVAGFGMLLRESPHVNDWTYDRVAALAQASKGGDADGYRSEFVRLVRTHGLLSASSRGLD